MASAPTAPSAPASKPAGSGKPSAPASKGGSDCPTLAPGHKYIWVDHIEGAMNNVVAADAQMHCDPAMNEGAAYSHTGDLKTYGLSLEAKITVILQNNPVTSDAKDGGLNGIAHVKACADPQGKQYMGTPLPAGYFCYGQNYYDVTVDSHNTITGMTELYGS
ncbi:hypothetical protein [Kitasatospora sp. LaBMicrA B282]|uniref:hypothetical protein n=1 Tax=Kitasatospora sp. LaBMicrA B282 TaxID=3420949 RepID=UPI003D0D6A26